MTVSPKAPRFLRRHFSRGTTRRDRKIRARARRILLRRFPSLVLPPELRRKGDPQ